MGLVALNVVPLLMPTGETCAANASVASGAATIVAAIASADDAMRRAPKRRAGLLSDERA